MSDHRSLSPVIRTKLYRPPVAADFVLREGLLQKLEEGFRFPLTLVSAPAGYGKSSLISHWLQSHYYPSSWLSLDESDNEFARFFTYFLRGFDEQTLGEQSKIRLVEQLTSPQPQKKFTPSPVPTSAASV